MRTMSDNAELEKRLANSNRNLHEMQEEHRELMHEMEMLRRRATELSRINSQPDNITTAIHNQTNTNDQSSNSAVSPPANNSTFENIVEKPDELISSNDVNKCDQNNGFPEIDDADSDTNGYIQEKMNLLAQLKAKFKNVKSIIETTKLIEEHMASKEQQEHQQEQLEQRQHEPQSEELKSNIEAANTLELPNTLSSNNLQSSISNTDNDDVIKAMLHMFTDFTKDLRSQAESLRHERVRLRALKEELLRRRQASAQSSKEEKPE